MQDTFGRTITYLRISVTDRCNLRCRYCMPADGVCIKQHEEMLTEDEIIMAARASAELGINKIRVTGGEPLVKRNIISICKRISEIPGITDLAITTNACLLPGKAEELKAAGVKRINISLDSLDEKKYEFITRGGKLSDALSGLDKALELGFNKIKINTVLIGGVNDDEIEALAKLTIDKNVDLRFIELMPMPSNAFGDAAYIKNEEVLKKLPELQFESIDGVSRMYCLPGAKGRVGLISPVSCSFCSECNRIRLTADGKIKPCLHSSEEISIKGLGFDEMKEQFIKAINDKPKEHKELSSKSISDADRDMNQIGG